MKVKISFELEMAPAKEGVAEEQKKYITNKLGRSFWTLSNLNIERG